MDQLMLHCGAGEVSRDQLALIEAPPPTDTWFPIKHSEVLDAVDDTLDKSGFSIEKSWLSIAKDGKRFFGVLDLKSQVVDDVSLSIGVRNSNDKSFPIGFCCGTRTFVCDNLAFSSDVVISKRHTRNGQDRYREGIANAISSLRQFQTQEAQRICDLRDRSFTDDQANSKLLTAYENGVVGARLLPELIREWREPRHEEFAPRTAYSMLNCYTEVMKPRFTSQPQKAAYEIMRFQSLLLAA